MKVGFGIAGTILIENAIMVSTKALFGKWS